MSKAGPYCSSAVRVERSDPAVKPSNFLFVSRGLCRLMQWMLVFFHALHANCSEAVARTSVLIG